MGKKTILIKNDMNIFKRFIFSYKTNKGKKKNKKIIKVLKKHEILKNNFSIVKVVFDDSYGKVHPLVYFRGYTKEGILTPLRKFTKIKGKVSEELLELGNSILMVDLFEDNIYLYKYTFLEKKIIGLLIIKETIGEEEASLTYTLKHCEIDESVVNITREFKSIDDFVLNVVI